MYGCHFGAFPKSQAAPFHVTYIIFKAQSTLPIVRRIPGNGPRMPTSSCRYYYYQQMTTTMMMIVASLVTRPDIRRGSRKNLRSFSEPPSRTFASRVRNSPCGIFSNAVVDTTHGNIAQFYNASIDRLPAAYNGRTCRSAASGRVLASVAKARRIEVEFGRLVNQRRAIPDR